MTASAAKRITNESILRHFGERRWTAIKKQWLGSLPPDGELHAPSEDDFQDLAEFIAATKNLEEKNGLFMGEFESTVFRQTLFHEACFNLYRALNLLSIAEISVKAGYPTTSTLPAYQCSFFASRSLLGFWGIGYAELENKYYAFDIWPDLGKVGSQGRLIEWDPNIIIVKTPDRIEHMTHWDLFIQAKRQLKQSDFHASLTSLLNQMKSYKDFSSIRNSFIYRKSWEFEDIIENQIDPAIGLVDDITDAMEEDENGLKTAQCITYMAFHSFSQIAAQSNNTMPLELAKLKRVLNSTRNPILYNGQLKALL